MFHWNPWKYNEKSSEYPIRGEEGKSSRPLSGNSSYLSSGDSRCLSGKSRYMSTGTVCVSQPQQMPQEQKNHPANPVLMLFPDTEL